MKLLRTIRLDPSDTFVFDHAAQPGEWAVTGGFLFSEADPAKLQGKERTAFRAGFLGVESLGWSTLVQIVEATADDQSRLVEALARQMLKLGAPDLAVGRIAAEEEVALRGIALHPAQRHADRDASQLREWRIARSLQNAAAAKWAQAASRFRLPRSRRDEEDTAQERVDLVNLAEESRK